MKIINNVSPQQWEELFARPSFDDQVIKERVESIIREIKNRGDEALFELAKGIDKVELSTENVIVSLNEMQQATARLPQELKDAIATAKNNIEKFHRAQLRQDVVVETMPGVMVSQKRKAIERVGVYIPGGSAPLFSTVLMCVVPAKIAGCQEVVMATPASANGAIADEILYTAMICGVDRVYKIGGAMAVAAMAYGTESVARVDKIFGPGNRYVTYAKQLVSTSRVAIDMPAGPSEVMVVADATADPSYVAADLLSQLEHGADSQAIAVVETMEMARQIESALLQQKEQLGREAILEESMKNCLIVVEPERNKVMEIVNYYAPEHLIVSRCDADQFAEEVANAGSIFIGNFSPESVGDYASGTNHTLPTSGWAKSYSGVNVDSFSKYITYQKLSQEGLNSIANCVTTMADAEGLAAHANAVKVRLGGASK